MRPGHGGPEPLEIGRAVPPQHVGDGGHGSGPHQLVDPRDRLLLADGGQMEVDHRGLQRAVAEVLLDQPEVDARLEQVGGVAVPQGVDRDGLAPAQLAHHPLHGCWTLDLAWGRRRTGLAMVACRWPGTARPGCDGWPSIRGAGSSVRAAVGRSGPWPPCRDGRGPSSVHRCRRPVDGAPR